MKNTFTEQFIFKEQTNRLVTGFLVFLMIALQVTSIHAQDRDGSIDLTGDKGRWLKFNHRGSGEDLGIEGGSFTIEGWYYLNEGAGDNLQLWKVESGDVRLSLSYKGDDKKTDEPWIIESRGIDGLGETTWDVDYNKNGSAGPDFSYNWRHVAFSVNSNSSIKIYIDGTLLASWNLVHDGSSFGSLFPRDGSDGGNCWISEASSVSRYESKNYVAEFRVWDTQLTDNEIATYYDEEVNSSHNHWGDLKRYYQGHRSSGSGESRTFTDVTGNYNASVANSDVTVATDKTPGIKPGDFDDNAITTNFSANTCNTDNGIDVSWTDFQGNSSYSAYTDPRYEVTRVSDGAAMYDGNGSSFEDTDVSPGDEEKYEMKTYWYIDGVKYYSDASIETNTGTMTEEFPAPSGFTASDDDCEANIILSWSALSPAPPKWTIQRANNSGFSSGVTTLTSSLDGTVTSYTDASPNAEQTYYYRIIASGNDDNNCPVNASYSVVESGWSSNKPTAPINFTVSVDEDNDEIDLAWEDPDNSLADGFILTRQKDDGTDRIEIVLDGTGTTTYSDDNIEICQTYEYSIAAYNECSPDGITSNTTHTALLGQDLNDYVASLTASKGYFGNSVRLEWEINGGLSQVDHFVVERAIAGTTNYQSIAGAVDNLVFEDENAIAGTFYTYRVYGQSTCNDIVSATNTVTDLGFRQPFGIVNGHIEYSGGNAVEDVNVNFERQDGTSVGKSLKFDGDGDYVAIDGLTYEGTDYSEMTIETWFKTTNNGYMILASADASEYWRLYISGGQVVLNIRNTYNVGSTNTYDDGEWHHLAAVFDNGQMSLYMDGKLDTEVTAAATSFGTGTLRYAFLGTGSEAGSFNGNTGPDDYFDGNMDEFRIWSIARTEEEISKSYNRLLSNEQSGLEVYYRFDEGTGSQVYDASKVGEEFNKHDGTFEGGVNFSDEIPDASLLGIKGITDEFGDYTADYIPYVGSGDVFRVTPAFGQHAFEPSSRSIYLGDGATVQNDVDFTDISSFTVSGKVTYENSEVPVEGVAIYIDGIQAVDGNNQAVRTDNEGNYTIDVPIGQHYLAAVKDHHTFSEGYFPALNEYDDIETHEFTEDLTVNFTDDTKITVAGRVVGGNLQAELPLGFNLSLNNVGVSTVEFQLQLEGYDLDVNDDAIYNIMSVTTDEYSGEYSIELIPEKWIINQAGNETYFIDPADISLTDLTNSLEIQTATNTIENEDGTTTDETYEYHHDLSFIIQSDPIIQVLDANGEFLHGEDSITFTDQETEAEVTLQLGDESPFLHDVYVMGVDYDVDIYVYEVYSNPDHPDYVDEGGLIDKVAVKEAEIVINDNLMINPEPTEGTTDDAGLFQYTFRAGGPSLLQDAENTYTKTFEIEASVNGLGITWNQGDTYRAYVLGAAPLEGTDFITYGPDQVDIVLRDPPGTNSYAFIEQGSSFSSAETWQFNQATSQGLDADIYSGMLVQAGGGLVGPVVKNETIYHTEIGLEIDRYIDYDGTYGRRVTFNERIETSSDPEDVGSMADLYIGRSLNAFFQETKNLKVLSKDYADANGLTYYGSGDYVLGEISGFTMDEGDTETYFVYSQRHILEELIPTLIFLRANLMTSAKYIDHLGIEHPCYGMSNDSKCLTDYFSDEEIEGSNQSYQYVGPSDEMDSVSFVNQQISNWLNAIAVNEAEKAEAITQTNLSIDGSTGAYSATLKEEYTSSYNWNTARSMNFYWNGAFANLTNNAGVGLNTTMNIDLNFGRGEEHTQERSLEFGYVIDERDEGDYYSIDIKKQDGIALFDASDFVDNIPSKDEFIVDQLKRVGIAGAVTAGVLYVNGAVIGNGISKLLAKSSNANVWVASLQFGTNLALWSYEMVDLSINLTKTIDKANDVESIGVGGFSIGSPIFSVRGGQSRCPYEPVEYANFYVADNGDLPQLHVATLQREVPTISSAPTIVSNVPDSEVATFTLSLGNDSESGTDVWYDLSIDESTNPDGAVILVDGVPVERSFLVPANEVVTKTLTIAPGTTGIMDYEDIGIVLHSACQADPASSVDVIADTVFVTAKFLPTCSEVEITNMNDNWIVNYEDGGSVPITLGGYDINSSTLESVSFLYKTLSGSPVTIKKYFVDEFGDAYINYDGDKGVLPGGEVSFTWDVSDLVDREYQIYAKSTCTDGSETESEYLTGLLDTSTPVVFGTPDPVDGVFNAGDDIRIQFSEELEADLVRDNNIVLKSVLNGADVSHATSVQFDGAGDEMNINSVSFNGKSFTIEYWAKSEEESPEGGVTILQQGSGADLVAIRHSGTQMTFQLGNDQYTKDVGSGVFTDTYPWDAWHHWAFIYDAEDGVVNMYMDDQVLNTWTNVSFNPAFSGQMVIGNGGYRAKMHELRLWEDERTYGEVIANMSQTLTGNEPGLYGYWPMDEGTGSLAIDQTAGRNATVNAEWSLEPGGVSWEFTGANYLSLDSRNVAIASETDLTVEFWFKGGAPADSVGLFTNGRGDGGDEITDSESVTSIIADQNGLIWVLSGGYAFQGTDESFFDNEWHHLAFVLDRKTNGKLYIDGSLQNQALASNFAGLSGSEIALGARIWKYDNNTVTEDIEDLYFTGYMDEVRVWNTARSNDLVGTYMHSKLEGDEVGLVAYTAFETYEDVQGAYIMEQSLADLTTDEDLTEVNDAVSSDGMEYYSAQKPPVRDVRGLQTIPFQYVVNGDEIIITPNVDMNRIEGQILEISVKNVQDLNGNRQLSPVTWTAYSQQNQITWDNDQIPLEKYIEDALTFTASFTNESGVAYDYQLENVPIWLSASTGSGVVNPQETVTITFEVSEALNIGSYEHGINLTTENGFDEKLNVSIRVYGEEPNWSVNDKQFQYSMTVFSRLIIEGEISRDPYDMVGAFVGDELRGVANLEYVDALDAYEAFVNIYSNSASGETITWKAYDASTGRVHEHVTPAVSFVANDIQGTVNNPIDLEAGEEISMDYQLNAGWNWISFNLNDPDLAVVNDLLAGTGSDGDIIKNRSAFDLYDQATGWYGTLTLSGGMAHGDMYKLYLSEAAEIQLIGSPVSASDNVISLNAGWNHLGYIPQFKMTLQEALVNMSPTEGDLIKTENEFAMYSDALGWVGSLDKMEPGQGYMLYLNNASTLEYPSAASLAASREINVEATPEMEIVSNSTGDNMSMVATVANLTSLGLSGDFMLVARADGKIRGYATGTSVNRELLYFLTITADVDETVTFEMYDVDNDRYHPLVGTTAYKADNVLGSVQVPFELGVAGEESEALQELLVAPNPFNEQISVYVPKTVDGPVAVKLIDLNGRAIIEKQFEAASGSAEIILREELNNVRKGLYVLLINYDGKTERVKVTKE